MISCAIHQPHFFPWLGYLNKMASVDKFIILDEAQLEKGSNMYRNKLSTNDGKEKYITVGYEKAGYLEKKYNEIKIDNTVNWQTVQKNFIINNYKKTQFFSEIWNKIEHIFENQYQNLDTLVEETIFIEKELFGIETEVIKQSTLKYDREEKNNRLLITLCKDVFADCYLSGNGAKKYMDVDLFSQNGIKVEYQKFTYPLYEQKHQFVSNLSGLDILFNCGIEKSRTILASTINNYL